MSVSQGRRGPLPLQKALDPHPTPYVACSFCAAFIPILKGSRKALQLSQHMLKGAA